jgi:phage FluMu gp28-like protein
MGLAYVVSYLFTAQVWVYLLLRRSLDATDFSEFDETGIGDTLASREMAAAKVPDEPVDAEPTVPEQEPGDAPA